MNKSLDYPQLVQTKPKPNKRKRKSWKGLTLIRKSARLNRDSVLVIVEIEFPNDESYHRDSKDNDILIGEILEDIIQNSKNKLQITLYHPEKSNGWNLIEEKLRLVQ